MLAYESRILQPSERHLQICEKKLLAVIHALSTWKHCLLGADFIYRDLRWAKFLSVFNFQVIHVEHKTNAVADALSRKPQVSIVNIAYHNELDVMKDWYAEDEQFAGIYDQLVNGKRPEHYMLKDGFMMMHRKLCSQSTCGQRKVMIHRMRNNVALIPPSRHWSTSSIGLHCVAMLKSMYVHMTCQNDFASVAQTR